MKKTAEYFELIKEKVNSIPFFRENTFSVNILIAAALTTFVLAGFDLSSQLALEKDEINILADILEDSLEGISIDLTAALNFRLPLTGALHYFDFAFSSHIFESLIHDRGPPQLI